MLRDIKLILENYLPEIKERNVTIGMILGFFFGPFVSVYLKSLVDFFIIASVYFVAAAFVKDHFLAEVTIKNSYDMLKNSNLAGRIVVYIQCWCYTGLFNALWVYIRMTLSNSKNT